MWEALLSFPWLVVDFWVGWYQVGISIMVCGGKVLLSGLSGDWCMLWVSDGTAFSLVTTHGAWNNEI